MVVRTSVEEGTGEKFVMVQFVKGQVQEARLQAGRVSWVCGRDVEFASAFRPHSFF